MRELPRVYIVVVNWNGWPDTVECLESVLRLDYPDFRVIVCDNDSSDGSLDRIREWAEGHLVGPAAAGPFAEVLDGRRGAPVACYVEYSRAEAERGGAAEHDAPLVLVRTGGNLGYAGGNNVGLRYALGRRDFEYVWLLNNDTIVQPQALSRLVGRMAIRTDAGMCGSSVLYYDEPQTVQALGGAEYDSWRARAPHIGEGSAFRGADTVDVDAVECKMSYVLGASMLVTKSFLDHVGLMSEEYFLYCEEIDWAQRAAGRYALCYAPDSIVYHKVGSSSRKRSGVSLGAVSLLYENRLRIAQKYFKLRVPTVIATLVAEAVKALLKGNRSMARVIFAVAIGRPLYAAPRNAASMPGLDVHQKLR